MLAILEVLPRLHTILNEGIIVNQQEELIQLRNEAQSLREIVKDYRNWFKSHLGIEKTKIVSDNHLRYELEAKAGLDEKNQSHRVMLSNKFPETARCVTENCAFAKSCYRKISENFNKDEFQGDSTLAGDGSINCDEFVEVEPSGEVLLTLAEINQFHDGGH